MSKQDRSLSLSKNGFPISFHHPDHIFLETQFEQTKSVRGVYYPSLHVVFTQAFYVFFYMFQTMGPKIILKAPLYRNGCTGQHADAKREVYQMV